MNRYLAISIFLVLYSLRVFTQPGGVEDSIMRIKGKWTTGEKINQSQDVSLKAGHLSLISKKMDSISILFKTTYPVPLGTDANWYSLIGQKPLFEKGPASYSFWSLYHYYYYNENHKKIIRSSETATWAYVFVNSFNWLLDYIKLDMPVDGHPVKIWRLPKQLAGQWKGYPLFETHSHGPNAKAAVITPNGTMPWRPVTQLQYLKALRNKKEEELKQVIKIYDDNIVKSRKTIEDLRNKKDLPQDSKSKMIAISEQQLEKQLQDREKIIKNNTAFITKDLVIIDEYLAGQPPQTLQQPALLNRHKDFIFQKRFEDSTHKDATPLVYIDQGDFDGNLPSYQPRFMVLYWRWNNNGPGNYFKKQLEENFPVEKLKAMLRK